MVRWIIKRKLKNLNQFRLSDKYGKTALSTHVFSDASYDADSITQKQMGMLQPTWLPLFNAHSQNSKLIYSEMFPSVKYTELKPCRNKVQKLSTTNNLKVYNDLEMLCTDLLSEVCLKVLTMQHYYVFASAHPYKQ